MAIEYRGYNLQLRSSGAGWRVFIYEPGASTPRPEVPVTAEMFGAPEVMAEARKIVDDLLSKPPA